MTILYALVGRDRTYGAGASAAITAMGALLLTVSAKVSVPFYPVPLTMQTFVVIGLGLALGSRRGIAAVLAYLALGAAGFPVFAGTPEKGLGITYLLGPTGGYLAGYVPAVLLAGWLADRGWDRRPISAFGAALLAGAVIYVPGLLWLGAVIGFDKPIFDFGLCPFILGDIAKAALAALTFPVAWRWLVAKGLI